MKRITIFCLLFVLTVAKGFAQTNQPALTEADTMEMLIVTGNFDGTVKDWDGFYVAKLIKDNKVIEEQTLKVKKQFEFFLRKNMLYAVKVEKEGYISKLVSISTKMPDKIEIEEPYKFNFETNLLSQELSTHFDDDDLDFPVALVNYGKKCDCFEYNHEYTAKLINNMYNNLLFGE